MYQAMGMKAHAAPSQPIGTIKQRQAHTLAQGMINRLAEENSKTHWQKE
jgi:hypothetical protein